MKKFIKDKRRKASEERKAQQEDSRRKKIQVQERLLALDAFRKTQVKLKSEMVSEASGRQKLVKNSRQPEARGQTVLPNWSLLNDQ